MNGVNKQLEKIGDTPVFVMSALKFERSGKVDEIIIAAPADEIPRFEKLARNFGITKLSAVTAGGETRAMSVRNALERVSPEADYIAIHDGARPLIETGEIERVFADAEKYNAAIAAVPATDTVKIAAGNGFVEKTPHRENFIMRRRRRFSSGRCICPVLKSSALARTLSLTTAAYSSFAENMLK